MRKALILAVFLLATGLAGGVEAQAYRDDSEIDPLAIEVVLQTWDAMSHKEQMRKCDHHGGYRATAKRIVRKYNSDATKSGKRELKAGYIWLLHNC